MNQYELYSDEDSNIDHLRRDMSTLPIAGMTNFEDGTSTKLIFTLSDGNQVIFKPMRFNRYREMDPNMYYFDEFERHHGEIGAFHVDRVMGFHRVPPVSGRFINITDAIEKYATKGFKETIFTSPAGNKCYYGNCVLYCDFAHAICGSPDIIEGSISSWIPFESGIGQVSWYNPWRKHFDVAEWEENDSFCNGVKNRPPYNNIRLLLDLMDVTVFDYLISNRDRHTYHTFEVFGNETFPLLIDNGCSFGLIYSDNPSILVPLEQCCQIRYSTLQKLLQYEIGKEKLSDLVRRSIMTDPLSSGPNGPILTDLHLKSLDRRVRKVLNAIWTCVNKFGYEETIIDDGL